MRQYIKSQNLFFDINNDINDHTVFFAWLFSPKAEHGLNKIPLLYLLNNFINKNIMNYEIDKLMVLVNNNTITVKFYLLSDTFLEIEVLNDKILILFEKKEYYICYNLLFDKLLIELYNISVKYYGKIIIRTFINESKLIKRYIKNGSYKSLEGRYKFLQSIVSNKYNVDSSNLEEFALKVINKAGEFIEYDNVIKLQNEQQVIYGPIFNKHSFNVFGYKLNGSKHIKPDILVIGSSRATPFQENFFNKSFYNASLVMQSKQ